MRRLAAPMLALLLLAISACGSDDDQATPAACLGPATTYLEALEDAPGEVHLEGVTAISECIVPDQEGGPLATVGTSMTAAATRLNRRVRLAFERDDAVRLGYLVGAVEAGAADTGGIHEDLVLRLNSAARFAGDDEVLGARFERAFGEGYAAGQERG